MIRVVGINLSKKKKIYLALTSIFGIGIITSKKILRKLKFKINRKVKNMKRKDFSILINYLTSKNLILEGNLRQKIYFNIQNLINMNSFRGKRLLKGLPVRGQRTRTNSRTSRYKKFIQK